MAHELKEFAKGNINFGKAINRADKKHQAKSKALKKKQGISNIDWAKHNIETGGKSVKGFEKYTG